MSHFVTIRTFTYLHEAYVIRGKNLIPASTARSNGE